jgi:short-subunit dehydrogenase
MQLHDAKAHWALVTGASEGIGREFCEQLAAAGLNLVLVARNEVRLTKVAQHLTQTHPIKTLVVAMDLSNPDAASQLKIRLDTAAIKVRLLINNAGAGRWGHFEKAALCCYQEMITLNTTAMVSLCHQFLVDLSSWPSSAVINVGSAAALQPIPYMAVYAASKAFVHSFSQALYGEWQERGVLVQTLVPGPTATHFDEKAHAYESSLTKKQDSPAYVVQIALAHLMKDSPLACAAKGTYKQRLLAGLMPAKVLIREVGRRFKPPV